MSNSTVVDCTLLAGTQLQPYWLFFVNFVLLWLINLLFKVFGAALQRCRSTGPERHVDPSPALGAASPKPSDNLTLVFGFNPVFGVVQTIGHVAHFWFIVAATGGSGWQRYTQIYTAFANSGVVAFYSVFASALLWSDQNTDSMKDRDPLISSQMVVVGMTSIPLFHLAPVFFTHLFPMWCAYCYLLLAAAILPGAIMEQLERRMEPRIAQLGPTGKLIAEGVQAIFTRFFVGILCMVVFQTSFNYGVLLYSLPQPVSAHDYINVIATEWNMRSTTCYLQGITKTARQAANFASIF